jgi:hypothetical protein
MQGAMTTVHEVSPTAKAGPRPSMIKIEITSECRTFGGSVMLEGEPPGPYFRVDEAPTEEEKDACRAWADEKWPAKRPLPAIFTTVVRQTTKRAALPPGRRV